MIKKVTYKIILVILLISSSSCNKWLDVKPQDGLIKQDFWKTKEQLESAVVGVYITLVENTVVSQLWKWGELRADLVLNAPTPGKPTVDEVNFIQGNILSTNPLADWTHIYRVINNCNLVIDNGPKVLAADKTFTLLELNQSLAEVRAIRALLYFYLLRTYGEVPLQTKGVEEDTQVESIPKSSKQEVYDLIVSDLKFAEENAVESFKSGFKDKGRITRYAVLAMEADVYLWNDEYQAAVDACDKIINSNNFGLVEGLTTSFFNELYVEGNSAEHIFAFQYSAVKPNPFYLMFIPLAKTFIANPASVDNVFPSDPANPTFQDLRSAGVSYRATDLAIWKYTGVNSQTARTATESVANFIVYRYADVLLMKAEALSWIGGRGQEVLDIVNVIRTRGQALKVSEQVPDINSSSSLADYVFAERGREFAFEGKRWFDLLRYAKRNNYEKLQTLIDLGSANAPANLQQSVSTKLLDHNFHYLPVPFREMQANKLLIQNPFYQ